MCEACHNKMHPEFLSTPSGWRATTKDKNPEAEDRVISIHALRVEGDSSAAVSLVLKSLFLSTPSGWRATVVTALFLSRAITFLSTPSGWRATVKRGSALAHVGISIHALRVEGDVASGSAGRSYVSNFYPRPPGGGRPGHTGTVAPLQHFYPRPPGGGRLAARRNHSKYL